MPHKHRDLLTAIEAGLENDRKVSPLTSRDFDDLVDLIAQTSHLITHLGALREEAIIRADQTSPDADRRRIAIAAGWAPSRVYRVLAKFGRPVNRQRFVPEQNDDSLL